MSYLYPDVLCPVCGGAHTLYHKNDTGRRGSTFSFVCPRTRVIVVCRPARGPRLVIRVPAHSIPMTRLAD